MSICRDLMMLRVGPIYRDFMVPWVGQFTEVSQRFYGASSVSIHRDFMMRYSP